mgnify:FL=1
MGIAFRADITVSMECVKLGCELFPGKLYAGETVSVPIGIDLSFFEKNKDVCITYDPEDIPLLLPKRAADSHKGDYGKILMITGSKGMAGAAYCRQGRICGRRRTCSDLYGGRKQDCFTGIAP